jgi:hypothetical protein
LLAGQRKGILLFPGDVIPFGDVFRGDTHMHVIDGAP